MERLLNKVSTIIAAQDDLDDAINGEGLSDTDKQALVRKKFERLKARLGEFNGMLIGLDDQLEKDAFVVTLQKWGLWIGGGIIFVAGVIKALHQVGWLH